MIHQTNHLNRKQKRKPLYIKDIAYVGFTKIIERPDPLIYEMRESYFLNGQVTTRARPLKLSVPVTHEIYLAGATITDSIDNSGIYNLKIAAMFNIYGSTKELLRYRSGITCLIDNNNRLYAMTVFKDVIEKLNPLAGPRGTLSRIENGIKVYAIQEITDNRRETIMRLLNV